MKKILILTACMTLAAAHCSAQGRQSAPSDGICRTPDVPPRPQDEFALIAFLSDRLSAPRKASGGAKGKAFAVVSMAIERDGTLTHLEVVGDSTAPRLDRNALRRAAGMPRFAPALKDGRAVRSTYSVAVPFWRN